MKFAALSIATCVTASLFFAPDAIAQSKPAQKPASKPVVKALAPTPAEIQAKRLKAHLEFIAHDLLEGRDTPSRGLDIAALYLATQMKIFGIEPAGDNGTYFQTVKRNSMAIDSANTFLQIGDKKLKNDVDFDAFYPPGKIEGEIEYVGFGYRIPSKGIDPYAGRDVRGKILLVLSGTPKGIDPGDLTREKISDLEYPTDAGANLGAKAILMVPPRSMSAGVTIGGRIPNYILRQSGLKALLEGESLSVDLLQNRIQSGEAGESVTLHASKPAMIQVAFQNTTLEFKNVVGMVRGTDPVLKNEYVAFGAHYDHVGINGTGADNIWNGADDDGSGTVSVLEIARAFAYGTKPKRSLLFVWHGGEEKGLWGAEYFVNHPTVPIDKIVTQLNIDMIGRSRKSGDTNPANKDLSDENTIYVIGSRMLSDDLGNAIVNANNKSVKMRLDYKYDDPKDPERFYYRSDHYHYASKGIPIAFFFNGVHEDYHGADDEVEKIDFKRMETISRLIYGAGWQIANTPARPKVNKKPQP